MKKKVKQKLTIMLFFVFVCSVFFLIVLDQAIRPALIRVAEARIQLKAQEMIHEAVLKNISTLHYEDLVEIHKDSDNRVVLIMPDTVLMNQISARTVLDLEKEMSQLAAQGFSLPLGAATGSMLFTNVGPSVHVGVLPAGMIDVKLHDEFTEAGINQTKHRIYLTVATKLQIAVPFLKSEISVFVDIPMTESVIVGPVPDWQLYSSTRAR